MALRLEPVRRSQDHSYSRKYRARNEGNDFLHIYVNDTLSMDMLTALGCNNL